MTLSDKKLLSFWQISFDKIKICPSSGLHADTVSIINLKNIRISSPTYGMPILHLKCSVTDKKNYFDERKLEKKNTWNLLFTLFKRLYSSCIAVAEEKCLSIGFSGCISLYTQRQIVTENPRSWKCSHPAYLHYHP